MALTEMPVGAHRLASTRTNRDNAALDVALAA